MMTGLYAQKFTCGTKLTPAMVAAERARMDTSAAKTAMFLPNTCLNKTLSVTGLIVADSMGNYGTSAGNIAGLLLSLESYFDPICVNFELCEVKYVDNFKYNNFVAPIDEDEFWALYAVPNTINNGFVDELFIDFGAQVGGYAALPGGRDIIMMANGSGPGVMLHEMGHFFGLYHTFETDFGLELANGTNCLTTGDLLCDTPADPNGGNTLPPDCNLDPPMQDPNGEWYVPDISNIMSYYNFCTCGKFTTDQYNRMAQQWLTLRDYLW
jgi:hypothetical protein